MRFRNLISTVLLTLLASGCSSGMDEVDVDVGGHPLRVEVARTPEEAAQGLMNRPSLDENRGMLFVYEHERRLSFWMKNTSIPLSIAFISSDGRIRQIEDMEPFSLAGITSERHVLYALEVNQGWFAEKGVQVGDRVTFPEDL